MSCIVTHCCWAALIVCWNTRQANPKCRKRPSRAPVSADLIFNNFALLFSCLCYLGHQDFSPWFKCHWERIWVCTVTWLHPDQKCVHLSAKLCQYFLHTLPCSVWIDFISTFLPIFPTAPPPVWHHCRLSVCPKRTYWARFSGRRCLTGPPESPPP